MQVNRVPCDHVQKDAHPGEVRARWWDPSLLPKPVVAEDDGPKRRRARTKGTSTRSDTLIGVWAVKQSYKVEKLAHNTEHCRKPSQDCRKPRGDLIPRW